MYTNNFFGVGSGLPGQGLDPLVFILFVAVAIWDLVWRGIGMWHAARNGQRNWFIALLIVNSIGILPILYLKLWQKKHS